MYFVRRLPRKRLSLNPIQITKRKPKTGALTNNNRMMPKICSIFRNPSPVYSSLRGHQCDASSTWRWHTDLQDLVSIVQIVTVRLHLNQKLW